MGFIIDLLTNIKDGFLKKSLYFVLTGIIAVITYFTAYNSGSNHAKYQCLYESNKLNTKIEKEMHEYRISLDKIYQERVDEIKSNHNSNIHDKH